LVEISEEVIGIIIIAVGASGAFYKLREKVNEMSVRQDVIWKIFEEQLPKLLVRPTHKEMDELIEKYTAHEATKEEMIALRDLIEAELNDRNTDPVTKMKMSFMKPVLDHNIKRAK
jgi:hypothetical protein